MQICQIIKDSFQEFIGEWSLVLFSYGCNFKCKFCYNLDYISEPNNIIGDAVPLIEKNISPAHTAVVFLGGEPTIWDHRLIEAVEFVKSKNLKTKIYTNASKPDVIEELEQKNIMDCYSIDFKAIKNVKDVIGINMTDSDYLSLLDKSISLLIKNNKNLELRTTTWDNVMDVRDISEYIKKKYPGINHILQKPWRVNS